MEAGRRSVIAPFEDKTLLKDKDQLITLCVGAVTPLVACVSFASVYMFITKI